MIILKVIISYSPHESLLCISLYLLLWVIFVHDRRLDLGEEKRSLGLALGGLMREWRELVEMWVHVTVGESEDWWADVTSHCRWAHLFSALFSMVQPNSLNIFSLRENNFPWNHFTFRNHFPLNQTHP